MKKVLVKWIDAFAPEGWRHKDELDSLIGVGFIVNSVGFIVNNHDKNYLMLAASHNEHEEKYCNLLAIPKNCIIKIKKL